MIFENSYLAHIWLLEVTVVLEHSDLLGLRGLCLKTGCYLFLKDASSRKMICHYWEVLLCTFRAGCSSADSHQLLQGSIGKISPNQNIYCKWFARFKSRNFSFNDQLGRGSHPTVDSETILSAMASQLAFTIRQLWEKSGVQVQCSSPTKHELPSNSASWMDTPRFDGRAEKSELMHVSLSSPITIPSHGWTRSSS